MLQVTDGVARRRLSLEDLFEKARSHVAPTDPVADVTPIDTTRLFVCPTLTPLYYVEAYRELSPEQALRANQISALSFNELILFFEQAFAPPVLTALARARRSGASAGLAQALVQFQADERRHSQMFRRLNQQSAPAWYATSEQHVLVIPRAARAMLAPLTRHPEIFPFVIWLMLAMEEHSIEVSRRCAQVPRDRLEPQWARVYRAHLEDEVRHVQLDWHMLERFYAERSWPVRRLNAALLRFVIGHFLVAPVRTGPRVVALLVEEFPELRPVRGRMIRELRDLGRNGAYLAMMYSRSSTPLTFALFDRFPELAGMSGVLPTYTPFAGGPA